MVSLSDVERVNSNVLEAEQRVRRQSAKGTLDETGIQRLRDTRDALRSERDSLIQQGITEGSFTGGQVQRATGVASLRFSRGQRLEAKREGQRRVAEEREQRISQAPTITADPGTPLREIQTIRRQQFLRGGSGVDVLRGLVAERQEERFAEERAELEAGVSRAVRAGAIPRFSQTREEFRVEFDPAQPSTIPAQIEVRPQISGLGRAILQPFGDVQDIEFGAQAFAQRAEAEQAGFNIRFFEQQPVVSETITPTRLILPVDTPTSIAEQAAQAVIDIPRLPGETPEVSGTRLEVKEEALPTFGQFLLSTRGDIRRRGLPVTELEREQARVSRVAAQETALLTTGQLFPRVDTAPIVQRAQRAVERGELTAPIALDVPTLREARRVAGRRVTRETIDPVVTALRESNLQIQRSLERGTTAEQFGTIPFAVPATAQRELLARPTEELVTEFQSREAARSAARGAAIAATGIGFGAIAQGVIPTLGVGAQAAITGVGRAGLIGFGGFTAFRTGRAVERIRTGAAPERGLVELQEVGFDIAGLTTAGAVLRGRPRLLQDIRRAPRAIRGARTLARFERGLPRGPPFRDVGRAEFFVGGERVQVIRPGQRTLGGQVISRAELQRIRGFEALRTQRGPLPGTFIRGRTDIQLGTLRGPTVQRLPGFQQQVAILSRQGPFGVLAPSGVQQLPARQVSQLLIPRGTQPIFTVVPREPTFTFAAATTRPAEFARFARAPFAVSPDISRQVALTDFGFRDAPIRLFSLEGRPLGRAPGITAPRGAIPSGVQRVSPLRFEGTVPERLPRGTQQLVTQLDFGGPQFRTIPRPFVDFRAAQIARVPTISGSLGQQIVGTPTAAFAAAPALVTPTAPLIAAGITGARIGLIPFTAIGFAQEVFQPFQLRRRALAQARPFPQRTEQFQISDQFQTPIEDIISIQEPIQAPITGTFPVTTTPTLPAPIPTTPILPGPVSEPPVPGFIPLLGIPFGGGGDGRRRRRGRVAARGFAPSPTRIALAFGLERSVPAQIFATGFESVRGIGTTGRRRGKQQLRSLV